LIILKGKLRLKGKPLELIKKINGMVWQGLVEKSDAEDVKNDERIISSRLYMGKIKIRLLSKEKPLKGFELTQPEIEDLYFSAINDIWDEKSL